MMEIDYSEYNREDLESALRSIDREKYPENYRNAMAALERVSVNPPAAPAAPAGPVPVYRNFWRRFFGLMIDGFILMPLGIAPFFLIRADFWLGFVFYILITPAGSLYHVLFHVRYGATPGKMVVGLKLMTVDLQRVGWRHAILRSLPDLIFSTFSVAFILQNLLGNRESLASMGFMAFSVLVSSGSVKTFSRLSMVWQRFQTTAKRGNFHKYLDCALVMMLIARKVHALSRSLLAVCLWMTNANILWH